MKVLAAAAVAIVALGSMAACGDDTSSEPGSTSSGSTKRNVKVGLAFDIGGRGDKSFNDFAAAGLDRVKTDLNLGSETVARQALKKGEISGYPEYVSTALTSFYDAAPEDVPADPDEAFDKVSAEVEKDGLVAFPQTPFASANAVGMLTSKAEELGVSKISDLEGKSQDLKLYGSPECRQRIDCLLGLQQNYGLEFASFTPVDIGLRYEVLDKGQADLSIVFTTDAQLGASDKYTILEDDKGLLPSGNVVFLTTQDVIDQAGPDYQATIEAVQKDLTVEVMQELDARVDIDKEDPAAVAGDYLDTIGFEG